MAKKPTEQTAPDTNGVSGLMATGLSLAQVNPAGASLGLQKGDTLQAINGITFTQGIKTLRERLPSDHSKLCVLTIRRGAMDFDVLTDTHELGKWADVAPPAERPNKRLNPKALCNWELFKSTDDTRPVYDLQPLPVPMMALIAAPMWLAQTRLWSALATQVALVALSLPVGLWVAGIVYAVTSLYVWRASRALFRADRIAQGLTPFAVIAAPNEVAAREVCEMMEPDLTYAFLYREDAADQDDPDKAMAGG